MEKPVYVEEEEEEKKKASSFRGYLQRRVFAGGSEDGYQRAQHLGEI